jgi:hypothetical protein
MYRGWAVVEQGRAERKGLPRYTGLDALRATGQSSNGRTILPCWLRRMASGGGSKGRPLVEALAQVEQNGERWYEAELYRLKGAAAQIT